MAKGKVSTTSKSLSSCEQVLESHWIEDSREVKEVASREALSPEIGWWGVFTLGWRDVDALPDDAYNTDVTEASGCKEVCATFGGGYSEVAVDYSGGILRLVLFSPLHL